MLLASPQAGLRLALRVVICFQAPIGPAHTSGGWLNDWRMMALVLPSAATDTAMPQPFAVIWSSACHRVSIFAVAGSTLASPAPPSTHSPKRTLPFLVQVNQLAEAFISGVTFLASPPVAGITKMSPPTEGSSLIKPPMNATDFPSGDHAGTAICSDGL